jgi:hypothetical protein
VYRVAADSVGYKGGRVNHPLLIDKPISPRSPGENPILPSSPINSDTSPDLSMSPRYRVINVAISTKNLSALVSQ